MGRDVVHHVEQPGDGRRSRRRPQRREEEELGQRGGTGAASDHRAVGHDGLAEAGADARPPRREVGATEGPEQPEVEAPGLGRNLELRVADMLAVLRKVHVEGGGLLLGVLGARRVDVVEPGRPVATSSRR
eukprot:2998288-Pyramimonas_sp.AAC.1